MGREFHYWRRTSPVTVPYEAYVPHTVAGWALPADADTASRVAMAERRLADLARQVEHSEALRWCVSRVEGIATSNVEGIVTTLRSLSLFESLGGKRARATDERDRIALGSVRLHAAALAAGARAGSPVGRALAGDLHRELFRETASSFEPGRLRTGPVWIGENHPTPAGAHYVPPPHDMVPSLMDDLMSCLSSPSWGPYLAKTALVHTQFETIHPFPDGNGRVGRALMHLVMRRDGHLSVPVLLSAAIDSRRDAYYRSLRPYQTFIGGKDDPARAEAMHASVRFIADAAVVACDYTELVARAISDWQERCRGARVRADSAASEILAVMETMPAVTGAFLAERIGRPSRSINRGLRRLVDDGLIAEANDPRSGSRTFENPAMLSVVDSRHELLAECWDLHAAGARG